MAEVPVVTMKGSDRLLCTNLAKQTIFASHHLGAGQVLGQTLRNRHDRIARTSSAMRNGPSLVEVVVHGVDSQSPQVQVACDGVHVCSIHVHETSRSMHLVGDCLEISLEDTRGVGVGYHYAAEASSVSGDLVVEVFRINSSVRQGFQMHDAGRRVETCHDGSGEIRAMSRFRDEHDVAIIIEAISMVGLKKLQSDEFSLGSCHRLSRHCG